MKAEDMFPPLSALRMCGYRQTDHRRRGIPGPGGFCGDRWWISLTTAKVTRLKGPCGPTGGRGCARVCSFY